MFPEARVQRSGCPWRAVQHVPPLFCSIPGDEMNECNLDGCGNQQDRQEGSNVINLRPNSLFCRKISSIHHHLKESEMNSVPAVPTTDQAVLPKII